MNNDYDDDMITCPRCGKRDYPEVGPSVCECFWLNKDSLNHKPCNEAELQKEIDSMNLDVNLFYKEACDIWGIIPQHTATHRQIRPNPTSTRSISQNRPSKRGKKFQGAYTHQRQFVKEITPNNVTSIPVEPKFPKEDELFQRLNAVVSDYSGELSLVATVGVLELLKLAIIERTK